MIDAVWLADVTLLFPAVRAKGNGFMVGSVTGPDVVRSDTFLRMRIGGRR